MHHEVYVPTCHTAASKDDAYAVSGSSPGGRHDG